MDDTSTLTTMKHLLRVGRTDPAYKSNKFTRLPSSRPDCQSLMPFPNTSSLMPNRSQIDFVDASSTSCEPEYSFIVTGPEKKTSERREDDIEWCACPKGPQTERPPRPPNAYILFRKNFTDRKLHLGFRSKDKSKTHNLGRITGECWHNATPEVKALYKALADRKEAEHRQTYPGYKYRPKQPSRRRKDTTGSDSVKHNPAHCGLCGKARKGCESSPELAPASRLQSVEYETPSENMESSRVGWTPAVGPGDFDASPTSSGNASERSEVTEILEAKRRRLNFTPDTTPERRLNDPAPNPDFRVVVTHRPPRSNADMTMEHPEQRHLAPSSQATVHQQGSSPTSTAGIPMPQQLMAPPPRPGSGSYSHRYAPAQPQLGHTALLTPLPNGRQGQREGMGPDIRDFILRLNILHRVHRDSSSRPDKPPGLLVVLEGDNSNIVRALGVHIYQALKKESDLVVKLVEESELTISNESRSGLADYHRFIARYLDISVEVDKFLRTGVDAGVATQSIGDASGNSERQVSAPRNVMAIENLNSPIPSRTAARPICIIPNYILHGVDCFANGLAPLAGDPYSNDFKDHWMNLATGSRGILGADLTIYVHDSLDRAKSLVQSRAEGIKFILHRAPKPFADGDVIESDIDPAALRRLKFEVGEFIRES